MWKVYLLNGTIITQKKCKWSQLPNQAICKICYQLPNKKTLTLSGFEAYIYIEEKYMFLYGAKGTVLDTINILGKFGKEIYQFSYNVRKGKALQRKGIWDKDFAQMIWNPTLKKFEFREPRQSNRKSWKNGVGTNSRIVKLD